MIVGLGGSCVWWGVWLLWDGGGLGVDGFVELGGLFYGCGVRFECLEDLGERRFLLCWVDYSC